LHLTRILKREKIEVVHGLGHAANVCVSLAATVAGTPSIVLSVTGLGSAFVGPHPFLQRAIKLMYRAASNRGAIITAENEEDRQVLSSVARGRVRLLSASGVDLNHFSPESGDEGGRAVRAAIGLNGHRALLFVGRLTAHKGINELIEAWRQIRLKHRDARLLLAGEPDRGNPYAVDAAALKGEERLDVLGQRSDVRELIALCDFVVNPSYREGLSRVNLEALAMGKPIVTTAVPGCIETVEDGVNGLLVPARDPHALADAMDRLLSDADLRRRLGAAGRQKAQTFSIERAASAMAALYDGLNRTSLKAEERPRAQTVGKNGSVSPRAIEKTLMKGAHDEAR
jgi:glycosyltransferase involved in cell wall biosynthesis